MTEELKQRFELWLEYCLGLEKFKKQYDKMLSEMRPINIEKFKNFEEINDSDTKNGKGRYTVFENDDFGVYNPKIKLIVGKNDLRYQLELVVRELTDIKQRYYGLTQNRIDADYAAVLMIDDGNLSHHRMYEVDIINNGKKYGLVCREWANFQIVDTQTKPLTEQQVNALLAKSEIKQL